MLRSKVLGSIAVCYIGLGMWARAPIAVPRPPVDIQETLAAHDTDLADMPAVALFDWLPAYYVKRADGTYSRIQGAHLFNKIIQKYKLRVRTPTKYGYEAANGLCYVIAAAARASGKLITLQELKELVRLAMEVRWTDCISRNFMKTDDGYITIIDTEPRFKYRLGYKLSKSECKALIYFLLSQDLNIFTPDAAEHVRTKRAKLEKKLARVWRT